MVYPCKEQTKLIVGQKFLLLLAQVTQTTSPIIKLLAFWTLLAHNVVTCCLFHIKWENWKSNIPSLRAYIKFKADCVEIEEYKQRVSNIPWMSAGCLRIEIGR